MRCYAAWASRTLELDGRPPDASKHKGSLPEPAVLEKPELPTLQEWKAALENAAECFGITFAGKHLSPDSQGRFRNALDKEIGKLGSACADVDGLLQRRAKALGVAPDAERLRTSKSAEAAVLAVRGQTGVGQVRTLAGFAPRTSGAALGRHLLRMKDADNEVQKTLADNLVFGP